MWRRAAENAGAGLRDGHSGDVPGVQRARVRGARAAAVGQASRQPLLRVRGADPASGRAPCHLQRRFVDTTVPPDYIDDLKLVHRLFI